MAIAGRLTMGASAALVSLAVLLFARAGAAQAPAQPGCARILEQREEVTVAVVGPGCDLRELVRLAPQVDRETGTALTMRAQLRSIYAENEARVAAGELKTSNVRRGCVPGKGAPADATQEELEICPEGIVSYYGIASGRHLAHIFVPRAPKATYAQRLESLGKGACGALGGVKAAYEKAGRPVPEAVSKPLSRCAELSGWSAAKVEAPAKAPSGAVSALPAVIGMTPRAGASSAGATAAPVVRTHAGAPPIPKARGWLGTVLVLLAGIAVAVALAFWLRKRAQRPPADQSKSDQIVVDRAALARAVVTLDEEYANRLESTQSSREQQLREQIAALREVELDYERALQQIRESLQRQLAERDSQIAVMAREQKSLTRDLDRLRAEAGKKEKRIVSLQTRLRATRHGGDALREALEEAGIPGDPVPAT